jgi:hypothetical protein
MEDREMKQHKRKARFWSIPVMLGVFVLGSLLGGAATASAQSIQLNQDICMQKAFGGSTVTSSNLLNCTANDVSLSDAIAETISPTSCDPNAGPFTLDVDFKVVVTSKDRTDEGFFFRTDGGANARGPAGVCASFGLDPTDSPAVNADGDSCGDLNQTPGTTFHIVHFTIPDVTCVAAAGTNPPVLRLPYCTSWHSNQNTVCNINTDNFAPEQKSKCVCNDNFTVPVIVQSPTGQVLKTAVSALVTYEVTVNNTGPAATLTVLDDSIYDDITKDKNSGTPNAKIETTNCAVPQSLAATTGTYTCQFKVLYANPGTAGDVSNTVTATLTRTGATPTDATGSTTINIDLGDDNRPPAP